MITDERLKQLMQQVGIPNSISLMQALRQCDMEATLAERERCAKLCDKRSRDEPGKLPSPQAYKDEAMLCAAAIRAS